MEQQYCTRPSSILLPEHDHAKCIAQCLLACAAISALHWRFDTIRKTTRLRRILCTLNIAWSRRHTVLLKEASHWGVVNALSSKLCFIVVSVCSHDSVAKVKQL